MKKVILIDGNNLVFRSYYATAYRGSILRNSKGFPTNALFGFINMLNKIIAEEKPEYMMIAVDKGKTFRHEKYKEYKDGRHETPDDLKLQFPVAKQIAKKMGIKCFEIDNYEADDIIGTFAKEVDINDEFISTIISSDKDLLQLISNDNEVKLLKTNDYIRMDKKTFIDTYGFEPIHMIDLKAIMGDSSDNIPGVKGIGEKGAIKLIQNYGTLEEVYNHIDEIKGKTKEKLENDKDMAFFSKELVTIYKDVPIDKDLNNIKYNGYEEGLEDLLKEYEFFSILKRMNFNDKKNSEDLHFTEVNSLKIDCDSSIFIETEGSYHDKKILGITVSNEKGNYYIGKDNISNLEIDNSVKLYTYDLKKLNVLFKYLNIGLKNKIDDLMLIGYLLGYEVKDDISSFMNIQGSETLSLNEALKQVKKEGNNILKENLVLKARFIFDNIKKYYEMLNKDNLSLYLNIDLPLSYVLSDMEFTGVKVDTGVLLKMKEEVEIKIKEIEKEIYKLSGKEFNINSPKQLGIVLFDELKIPYPKKLKAGKSYSTSADILDKLKDYEIVSKVLEYRSLIKIYSNYIIGTLECIKEDGLIHTTFNQTLTRTGRLSSTNPNLQNIPIREEYGRRIRKAFIPQNDIIISSDYSQIELRVFAHMAKAINLIEAFKNNMDIHKKTAMDIYHIKEDEVTSTQRRDAKAVNFGILYGISSFGLSEDLGISFKESKKFIDDYLNTYPQIKDYMEKLKENAYKTGYVKTIFGRERKIEELNSSNFMVRSMGERMALNTPIQGTAADIMKIAMINIYKKLKEENLKSRMIVQVHDEILIDTKKEEKDIVIDILTKEMENAYKLDVPLKVQVSVGSNWYEVK